MLSRRGFLQGVAAFLVPNRLFRGKSGVWVPNGTQVFGQVHYLASTAPVAATPPSGVLIGFQQFPTQSDYLKTGVQETPAQQYARHMLVYGHDDIQKLFYSASFTAGGWNPAREGANTGTQTVIVCHNTGGISPSGTANVMAGQYDAQFIEFLRSVPSPTGGALVRRVLLTYNQEADADLLPSEGGTSNGTLTKAQYKGAFNHFANLIHADMAKQGTPQAVLNPGVVIDAHGNFMNTAFRQGVWTDDRVPEQIDSISWDMYLNPPPTISGSAYEQGTPGASGASAAGLHSATVARLVANPTTWPRFTGFWGWAETGAPWRTGDTSGNGRATAFNNLLTELKAAGGNFACIWDSDTGQWDHRVMAYDISPAPSPTSGHQGVWPGPGREPAIAVIRSHMGT